MTIIPFECWSAADIWLQPPKIFSPYWLYVTIFSLYATYALIEAYIGFFVSKSLFVRVVSPLLFIVASGFLLVMYCFWVFFKIESGELTYIDYPIKIMSMPPAEQIQEYQSKYPSQNEIVIAERCDKGLAVSTMTREDWEHIWKIQKAYNQGTLNN
ncbi:hypothetical protein [Gilvimarinus polysaccharolyticus]|uniref:hypothetical protein n=1 Tax=Gilvimarinus polysaccharolyticus TaxID=863921 RepID=UPI0012F9C448|nr:hypothetical protein [Gilvimarinus polysaccharolyticus]